MAPNCKTKTRIARLILLFLSMAHALLEAPLGYAENLCVTNQRLPSMGTFFEIQIANPCANKVDKNIFAEVQVQLDEIESELSLYQTESSLNRLNRDGRLKTSVNNPTESKNLHILTLLPVSTTIHKNTGGAFDISILPLLQLIQISFKTANEPPRDHEINKLKTLVDMSAIQIKNGQIIFNKKNMGVTFDGIAKGYAVDKIANKLEALDFKNYLLNFSGNMHWQGIKSINQRWQIALWNPITQKPQTIPGTTTGAISSSGSENTYYSADRKWHHIINPKTLKPPNAWAQTSVHGPSAMICDALSTAFFVLNKSEIKHILRKHYPEYSAWGFTPKGQMISITK